MKTKIYIGLACTLAAGAIFGACNSEKKEAAKDATVLIDQTMMVNDQLQVYPKGAPSVFEELTAKYEHDTVEVAVDFASPTVDVNLYSDALVEYIVAFYFKDNTAESNKHFADAIAEQGAVLEIDLDGANDTEKKVFISGERVKQLYALKPMQVNYNDAKMAFGDIMSARCADMAKQYNAADAEFSFANGFAQYTLTFDNPSAFAHLDQGSLRGRYLPALKKEFADMGTLSPVVKDFMKTFGIDGFKYVYTDKAGAKKISAAIPWNIID